MIVPNLIRNDSFPCNSSPQVAQWFVPSKSPANAGTGHLSNDLFHQSRRNRRHRPAMPSPPAIYAQGANDVGSGLDLSPDGGWLFKVDRQANIDNIDNRDTTETPRTPWTTRTLLRGCQVQRHHGHHRNPRTMLLRMAGGAYAHSTWGLSASIATDGLDNGRRGAAIAALSVASVASPASAPPPTQQQQPCAPPQAFAAQLPLQQQEHQEPQPPQHQQQQEHQEP